MPVTVRTLGAAMLMIQLAAPMAAQQAAGASQINDYPTITRADYIFGCLAVNGQDRDSLGRCACSIDVIASILPHEDYVAAETVMSLRQGGGERAALFRGTPQATSIIAELRRAQAEAEIICF